MRIMAVDLGDARTGLAVCDPGETLASPHAVLHERDREKLYRKISDEAEKAGASLLVVGYPRNMDGSAGFKAKECEAAAARLSELGTLPVRLWDERCTTVSAISALNVTNTRGKKRKAIVDAVAAVMILEDYLRWRKNNPSDEHF